MGSILWSGSELGVSKTRKSICGYLLVERQEVNKVVSLCSDPVFHNVHILFNRNMTNLKIHKKQFSYGMIEDTSAHVLYPTSSSQSHLGRVGSRLSQLELFSMDTYHTFLLYYQHCLWKVISSSNPKNSFSDCFLMHLVSVNPLICQVILNRSFHDFLWGLSFKMRTHFTWESHQQFASVTWPLSILSQLSVLFKLKLLVAYFYCCSGVKWR